MKRALAVTALVLSVILMLTGCFRGVLVIPNQNSIGEYRDFEKDGIKLTLTDKFTEKNSEMGFDAYYESDFCGVVVLKEEFTLKEGLAEKSLEDYITGVIRNNGHTSVKPQHKDGLWYYVTDKDGIRRFSYAFKGSDAFWIVQFLCVTDNADRLQDLFYLWASWVEVN